MRAALLCNLLGALLLFFSFQATSSDFRLISAPDGRKALCVDQRAMLIAEPNGAWAMGSMTCPDWQDARPAAVVNLEMPWMATLGLILFSVGFLLQFLSIPSPKTIAQLRDEIKKARLAQRAKDLSAQR